MKLSQYKEKKNHKKILIAIGAILLFVGGIIVEKTFANFKENKSFKVMEGNFIYEGSGDIIFAFYQGDENVGTMPTKDSGYVFNAKKSSCDNNAKIIWNNNEWGPIIVNLNKTKTKCNLYFLNIGTIRKINGTSDKEGMWEYKDKLTKIVIETTKNEKEANNGQIVHGPYDESEKKDNSVESYVVCDANDSNCIGYLQGDKGIALNDDSSYLFCYFKNVTQIEGIENLYTSNVENMSYMFSNMRNIEELDVSSFDTSNVTDMSGMFQNMEILQKLTFGKNFDTHNVTNMNNMFSGMSSIKSLDLTSFVTSNVTNMNNMFLKMSNLQTLDLSSFDTSNVTTMNSMFSDMSSIQKLDISSFDTSNVTIMSSLFSFASKLETIIYGSNFIHKDGASIGSMFNNCPANKPDKNVHPSWEGVSFN